MFANPARTLCLLLMMLLAALGTDTLLAAEPAGGDFYVATDGNDEGPGSRDKPFRSLERARDAVRERKARAPEGPVTVLIRGGTYRLEQSVVFSGRDSGSATGPITYRAYPGEIPVFSGGRLVTGWKTHREQIVWAQLPRIENQYYRFRELFLDGKRQIRARYPNFDPRNPQLGRGRPAVRRSGQGRLPVAARIPRAETGIQADSLRGDRHHGDGARR